jgi:hypothetical protein
MSCLFKTTYVLANISACNASQVYGGWLESGHDVTKQAAVCVADAIVQAARAAGALGPCAAIAGVLSWT